MISLTEPSTATRTIVGGGLLWHESLSFVRKTLTMCMATWKRFMALKREQMGGWSQLSESVSRGIAMQETKVKEEEPIRLRHKIVIGLYLVGVLWVMWKAAEVQSPNFDGDWCIERDRDGYCVRQEKDRIPPDWNP